MNILEKLKKNILYLFLSLPIILVGYESFMSLALGSRAWSFLLIGQVVLVPFVASLFYFIYNTLFNQNIFISLSYLLISIASIILMVYIINGMNQNGPTVGTSTSGTSTYEANWQDFGYTAIFFIVPLLLFPLIYTLLYPANVYDFKKSFLKTFSTTFSTFNPLSENSVNV